MKRGERREGKGTRAHLEEQGEKSWVLDLHTVPLSNSRNRESLLLPSGSTLLALGSWFWLLHRDVENMNIPGIHYGNRVLTLALHAPREEKLPEAWGQLHQQRRPQDLDPFPQPPLPLARACMRLSLSL